jgi:hypothetical protein
MVRVRCCVELLLISVVCNAFAGCDSLGKAWAAFQHFDDVKRLGTLLAIIVVLSGARDLIHDLFHWLRRPPGVQKS